jgi:hypothetical protein
MALHHLCRAAVVSAGLLLGAALIPTTALAGTTVAESIISRNDAVNDAKQLMPTGAIVSQVDCIELIRDLSTRYRCIVQWIPVSQR